jgi:hypothetical protein
MAYWSPRLVVTPVAVRRLGPEVNLAGRRWFGGLLTCVLLAGCARAPTRIDLTAPTAPHRLTGAPANITDGRARFRQIFCSVLASDHADDAPPVACSDRLLHLADEPDAPVPAEAPRSRPLRVYLVSGAFAECAGEAGQPFHAAIAALEHSGHSVHPIVVGGRSGAAHNARQIADVVGAQDSESDLPVVLVGHSKGTVDILRFLVDFPDLARDVDAVVSVAGAVGGSLVADWSAGMYGLLLSHLPYPGCETGDGQVIADLRPAVRREWLAQNPLPAHVRYFSLAAFTTREHLARALAPSWYLLLRHDLRNDGQLLPQDALVPGSTVLGYLNADHWAAAVDLEKTMPFLAHREVAAPFPRTALIEATLLYVAESLGPADPGAAATPPAQPAPASR